MYLTKKPNSLALAIALLLIFFVANESKAAKYAVSNIPDSLKVNANAVIREQHTEFRLISPTRARLKERRVVTILDKRGEGLIDLKLGHDAFRTIRSVSGTLYDENGLKIRDLRKNEFNDQSSAASYTLYAETRVTYTDIFVSSFPVTVEYEYEIEYRNAFFPPSWVPQTRIEVSVQEASFSLILPPETSLRYKFFNHENLSTNDHNLGDENTNKWYIRNLKAVKSEPFMPPFDKLIPYMLVSYNDFSYGGYKGNFSTWRDFGLWIAELNKDKQKLPPATAQHVKALVKDVEDPLEKARIIYEYVQGRTRYVNITLGIGGLQPYDAITVDNTGYGDCKALSNFTQALLQEVGVTSYYSVIKSGSGGISPDPDFPDNLFNHIIVCVPYNGDTLWLETTNSRYPVGYIGSGNSNRHALLITEEGGVLVRTPAFTRSNSQRLSKINASLGPDGSLQAQANSRFEGLTYEQRLPLLIQGQEARRRFYLQSLGVNTPNLESFHLNEIRSRNPVIEEEVSFSVRQYASRAGNRLFLEPNLLGKASYNPPVNLQRTHDIYLTNSPLYADTVKWTIPSGYKIAHIPADVIEDTDFGYYEAKYELEGDNLKYYTAYYSKRGRHSPERYSEFAEFRRKIYTADRAQVVLIAE